MSTYPNRDRLNRLALAVLEDALAQAEHGIVLRHEGHRLALAWLSEIDIAKTWQCREFWRAMIRNETGQIGDFPRYCRTNMMMACLRSWYRAIDWPEPSPSQRSQWAAAKAN